MNYTEFSRASEAYLKRYKTYNAAKIFLYRWYFRIYHRLEIIGRENIPDGPALIAANHTGGLDLDLQAISWFCHPYREITPLITESWHYINSLWGRLVVGCGLPLPALGGIQYDYLDPYLREGGEHYPGLICIFPEGNIKSFQNRYRLGKFYPGVVRIALHYRIPIIPAALIGFQHACPVVKVIEHKNSPDDVACLPFSFPCKLKVEFGKPIYLEDYYGMKPGKEGEYWIANTIVREEMFRLLEKHVNPSLDAVDVPMKQPEMPAGNL